MLGPAQVSKKRLLYVVVLLLALVCLLNLRVGQKPSRQWPRRRVAIPWPFLEARRVLYETLPATCPVGRRCVSFGTPLFGSWKTWVVFAATWTNGFRTCPVNNCALVANPGAAEAVIFHARDIYNSSLILRHRQLAPEQRWVYFSWESPISIILNFHNVFEDKAWQHVFNWTATYQRSSDIHTPYGRTEHLPSEDPVPFPGRRKHLAFAVLSNCKTPIRRLPYLQQLQKHMEVHIFGHCGRPFPFGNFSAAARDYHFFLAMENSRCKDYITEKFWRNGLEAGVVPVVFGAPGNDYHRQAPPGSFVLGEAFRSPKDLAAYLKQLAGNKVLYNAFFNWRRRYRLSPIDKAQDVLCKLCDKLHTAQAPQSKDLFAEWSIDSCNKVPWI